MTEGVQVRFAWLARLFGRALAAYVHVVAATCRISGSATRDQVVLAFWHEFNLVALIVSMRRRAQVQHASFSTRGFRGIVITTLLEHTRATLRVIALPPENDRAAARDFALKLARLGSEGRSPVVTPDGPFGPYRIAKPGTLIVARAAGLPIQPWAVTARPALRLTRRWDRQILPLPFCRLHLTEGARIVVGARERLSPRVADLQAELDRISGPGPGMLSTRERSR